MAEKEREALVKLYNIAHYITVKDVPLPILETYRA